MGNGKGYEVDPDKMREAIKLAESMLEELEERAYEVPDLVGMPAPSTQEDKVTNEYHNGQKVGARTSAVATAQAYHEDRKSTRLNSSHVKISYAGFCWKKIESFEVAGGKVFRKLARGCLQLIAPALEGAVYVAQKFFPRCRRAIGAAVKWFLIRREEYI